MKAKLCSLIIAAAGEAGKTRLFSLIALLPYTLQVIKLRR